MMMDPKKLSMLIRAKKNKLRSSEPDIASSEPHGYMNAQDVEDNKQLGRIEDTLEVPEKSMSENTEMKESPEDANTVGLTSDEKKRMSRLRSFLDMLDMA
jgi:hypothetical protein